MSVWRFIIAIKLFFINRKFTTKEASREHCLALLALINADKFRKYKPTDWSNKKIELLYPRINLFTEKIKKLNLLIVSSNIIESGTVPDYKLPVDMDTFFTSSDGFYINHLNEVSEFKQTAVELCELTQVYEKAKFGVEAHNRRILTPIYTDIRNLTLKLITHT